MTQVANDQVQVICGNCSSPTGEFRNAGEAQHGARCELCESAQIANGLTRWTQNDRGQFTRSHNHPEDGAAAAPEPTRWPGECQRCGGRIFTASAETVMTVRWTLPAWTRELEEYDDENNLYYTTYDSVTISDEEPEVETPDIGWTEMSEANFTLTCNNCDEQYHGEHELS